MYLSQIAAKNGAGVILREPKSMYGQSKSLKTMKPKLTTEIEVLENQFPRNFVCKL